MRITLIVLELLIVLVSVGGAEPKKWFFFY